MSVASAATHTEATIDVLAMACRSTAEARSRMQSVANRDDRFATSASIEARASHPGALEAQDVTGPRS